MNKVILKGRLTKDVELKYTQSAEPKAYCTFGIAVNGFNNRVDFINCVAWEKTAEFLEKYFSKGQEILLEGRINVDVVQKQEGNITYTKVMAERIEFCGNKNSNSSNIDVGTSEFDEEDDMPF